MYSEEHNSDGSITSTKSYAKTLFYYSSEFGEINRIERNGKITGKYYISFHSVPPTDYFKGKYPLKTDLSYIEIHFIFPDQRLFNINPEIFGFEGSELNLNEFNWRHGYEKILFYYSDDKKISDAKRNGKITEACYIYFKSSWPSEYTKKNGEPISYIMVHFFFPDQRFVTLDKDIHAIPEDFLFRGKELNLNEYKWSEGCVRELYHYTNMEGHKSIEHNRQIKGSTYCDDDASFGEGIYLTSIKPSENDKRTIAMNNWGPKLGFKKYLDGFTDYYIKILMPSDHSLKVCRSERNIFLYELDIIYLDLHCWESGKTPGDTMSSSAGHSNNSNILSQRKSTANDTDRAALLVGGLAAAAGGIAIGKRIYDNWGRDSDEVKEEGGCVLQ